MTPAPAKNPTPEIYTVTQLTRLIKLALNRTLPDKILLSGEISNFKLHSSGHFYLTLKDENAQISAAMWKSAVGKLKFQPADGMAVVATGRVDIYEPQGKYQFYIEKLEPAGVGALELAFRQLAEKLRQEGLFDQAHKKAMPAFPETIAIVTSKTGAAIRDIEKTLNRRFRSVRKLLYPVAVQGESAAAEIARAIRYLNRQRKKLGGIDVIIVARGGGSIEDLWAFNEEVVARAIFASEIPIISGVGHESDLTITDLVADQRAATPTAAAELATPAQKEILQDVQQARQRLVNGLRRILEYSTATLMSLSGRGPFARPLEPLRHRQQYVDEQTARLAQRISEQLGNGRRALEGQRAVLQKIEPHYALAQGQTRLLRNQHLLETCMSNYYQNRHHNLETLKVKLTAANPADRARQQYKWLKNLLERIGRAQGNLNRRRWESFKNAAARLESVNPQAVLLRGYSITRDKCTGGIITAESSVAAGDILMTELAQKKIIASEVIRSDNTNEDHDG